MTAAPILVCEPQCRGFEHARHNAALLATVTQAFPGHPVTFLAEAEHLEAVRRIGHTGHLDEATLPAGEPGGGAVTRMRSEWRSHAAALRLADSTRAGLLLFASLGAPGLLALHGLLRLRRGTGPVLAIVHGALADLEHPPHSVLHRALGLRQSLRWPPPPGLRLISLGEPIQRALEQVAPHAAPLFMPLDLPYAWERDAPRTGTPGSPPCFGFLGVANRYKGFDRFVRVAQAVRDAGVNARFVLAGFVPGGQDLAAARGWVDGLDREPLLPLDYAARLDATDYVLWTGEPSHYRLTASGSFQDALSFVKPGVYLRNAYIEHYAGLMGDIGPVCGAESDLVEAVIRLARAPDPAAYAEQCAAILSGRKCFEPEHLAPKLRALAEAAGFAPAD